MRFNTIFYNLAVGHPVNHLLNSEISGYVPAAVWSFLILVVMALAVRVCSVVQAARSAFPLQS